MFSNDTGDKHLNLLV